MVFTPENMVEHMQVLRNVRNRCRATIPQTPFSSHISLFNIGLVLLGHAIKEVDMAEMPTNGLRVTGLHQILHHGCPAVVLLRDNHFVDVQNSNVLVPVSCFC